MFGSRNYFIDNVFILRPTKFIFSGSEKLILLRASSGGTCEKKKKKEKKISSKNQSWCYVVLLHELWCMGSECQFNFISDFQS